MNYENIHDVLAERVKHVLIQLVNGVTRTLLVDGSDDRIDRQMQWATRHGQQRTGVR